MIGFLLINLLELLAFVLAVYYNKRNKTTPSYYLAWFLGLTFFFDSLNWYTYFVETGLLSFLKGTVFESNYWLGNIYAIISYLF